MSDKPISPLRQRMIDDMTARRVKEKVQKDYVRHVRTFAAFLGRPPDTATSEDLRRFQLHLARQEIGVGPRGGGVIPTPALDRIANAGLRYTQFHSTSLCSPTRAALITGRRQDHRPARVGRGPAPVRDALEPSCTLLRTNG